MADFPVYQPQRNGLEGLDQLINVLARNKMDEQRKQEESQNLLTQLTLGVGIPEIKEHAPEYQQKISSLDPNDPNFRQQMGQLVQEGGQVAMARRNTIQDLQAQRAAIANAYKTPGSDNNAAVASYQNTMTDGTLSPEQVQSAGRGLEAAVVGGGAEAAQATEQRQYGEGEFNRRQAAELQQSRALGAEAEARQKSVIDYNDLSNARMDLAKHGVSLPKKATREDIEDAYISLHDPNAQQFTPEERKANAKVQTWLQGVEPKLRSGKASATEIQSTLKDALDYANNVGSPLVPVLEVDEKGFISDTSTVRFKPPAVARAYFARMQDAGGASAEMVDHVLELANTGQYPALARVFQRVTPAVADVANQTVDQAQQQSEQKSVEAASAANPRTRVMREAGAKNAARTEELRGQVSEALGKSQPLPRTVPGGSSNTKRGLTGR